MRRIVLAGTLAAALAVVAPAQGAAPKAGAKCPARGAVLTIGQTKLLCLSIKVKGKPSLRWVDASPLPTTTSATTPAVTSTSTTGAPTTTAAPTTTIPATTTTRPIVPFTGAPSRPGDPVGAGLDFSGSGSQAVGPFTLAAGMSVVTGSCTCSGNFIVDVLDASGRQVDLAVNLIGNSASAMTIATGSGQFMLNVSAQGAWTIHIEQPRPSYASYNLGGVSGQGTVVVGPFAGGGPIRFSATSTGSSNFIVEAVTLDGSSTLLANEIAPSSSSRIFTIDQPVWYMAILAKGRWSWEMRAA